MLNDYTVIDLETTGLSPKEDRIIEIAAVKVRDGIITDTFETLLNPDRTLRQETTEITGISQEDIEKAPDLREVMSGFLVFLEEDVLIGHRVLFDYSFLKRAASYLKLPFVKQGIDTLQLARKLMPELESKSLTSLCEYFHITHQPHRAMEDAAATRQLYEKLSLIDGFEELALPKELNYSIKKETPVTKPQKEQLYKLMCKHRIVLDYDIDKLTRNEASRIMDKIFAAYGR